MERNQNVIIYDTTLRDGMQGIEINYSLEDKLQIAHELDTLAIDYIEGGFPHANEKEAAFFREIKKNPPHHAKIVAFGSTRKPKMKAENDPHIRALHEADTPAVMVVGKTWKEHVTKVLKTDVQENLCMISDSISFLKQNGREVFFDLEHFFDGYKDDPEYAIQVLRTGTEAGADCLILCDTNGGTLPGEVHTIINALPKNELAPLGVHFHNDTGNAVANTLLSVEAGAVHVQGTINGWGERCGNANLCSLIPNICIKMKRKANVDNHLEKLTSLSRFVAEKANIIPDKRQPYVGQAAFTHKAGQHVDVLSKADFLMEHMSAELVGNERKIILSELAGKSTVLNKIKKYGNFDKNSDIVKKLTYQLKTKEKEGYEYEAAEASFELLILKALGKYVPLFELNNYHLESYKTWEMPSKTVGRIFLRVDKKEILGAAVCVGPVETLDAALRDALGHRYPFIKNITLVDYRVRVLNPEKASSAQVRVFITTTDHKREWDTVGVSQNIVEASWEALIDSLEFYYNSYVIPNSGN